MVVTRKCNRDEVIACRKQNPDYYTYERLAVKFNISKGMVCRILNPKYRIDSEERSAQYKKDNPEKAKKWFRDSWHKRNPGRTRIIP